MRCCNFIPDFKDSSFRGFLNAKKVNFMKQYGSIILKSGLKRKWIADQLGISPQLFSMYLNGSRKMPSDIDFKLEKLLSKFVNV